MEPSTPPAPAPRGPWGALATLGFGLLAFLFFAFLQTMVLGAFVGAHLLAGPPVDVERLLSRLETDGFVVAVAAIASAPGAIGAVVFAAWLRRGPSVREYLGLRAVPAAVLARWVGAAALLIAATDLLTWATGHSVVPDWVLKVYTTARFRPLLVLALVVAAPLAEEFLFRGFLIEGLKRRLDDRGAIIVAAVSWALIHVQYGFFQVFTIFLAGLLLGDARTRTGSLLPPILMHALINLVATVEVAIVAR